MQMFTLNQRGSLFKWSLNLRGIGNNNYTVSRSARSADTAESDKRACGHTETPRSRVPFQCRAAKLWHHLYSAQEQERDPASGITVLRDEKCPPPSVINDEYERRFSSCTQRSFQCKEEEREDFLFSSHKELVRSIIESQRFLCRSNKNKKRYPFSFQPVLLVYLLPFYAVRRLFYEHSVRFSRDARPGLYYPDVYTHARARTN